ncbi:hypothetical protein BESB_016680 [Besnoitia besnoiti]|uniref:EGF-like domain-containing protein n=1 Tax=Besnoitia besnoiti TaxID=94643 RepID=A0A2A9MAF7_BESBE|nr:hypothetical protein BESB_016680 [Besnoitia besnoiti]PFH32350.1 hypothetical protein BESB_016680 [Besnoitia besnoiti]
MIEALSILGRSCVSFFRSVTSAFFSLSGPVWLKGNGRALHGVLRRRPKDTESRSPQPQVSVAAFPPSAEPPFFSWPSSASAPSSFEELLTGSPVDHFPQDHPSLWSVSRQPSELAPLPAPASVSAASAPSPSCLLWCATPPVSFSRPVLPFLQPNLLHGVSFQLGPESAERPVLTEVLLSPADVSGGVAWRVRVDAGDIWREPGLRCHDADWAKEGVEGEEGTAFEGDEEGGRAAAEESREREAGKVAEQKTREAQEEEGREPAGRPRGDRVRGYDEEIALRERGVKGKERLWKGGATERVQKGEGTRTQQQRARGKDTEDEHGGLDRERNRDRADVLRGSVIVSEDEDDQSGISFDSERRDAARDFLSQMVNTGEATAKWRVPPSPGGRSALPRELSAGVPKRAHKQDELSAAPFPERPAYLDKGFSFLAASSSPADERHEGTRSEGGRLRLQRPSREMSEVVVSIFTVDVRVRREAVPFQREPSPWEVGEAPADGNEGRKNDVRFAPEGRGRAQEAENVISHSWRLPFTCRHVLQMNLRDKKQRHEASGRRCRRRADVQTAIQGKTFHPRPPVECRPRKRGKDLKRQAHEKVSASFCALLQTLRALCSCRRRRSPHSQHLRLCLARLPSLRGAPLPAAPQGLSSRTGASPLMKKVATEGKFVYEASLFPTWNYRPGLHLATWSLVEHMTVAAEPSDDEPNRGTQLQRVPVPSPVDERRDYRGEGEGGHAVRRAEMHNKSQIPDGESEGNAAASSTQEGGDAYDRRDGRQFTERGTKTAQVSEGSHPIYTGPGHSGERQKGEKSGVNNNSRIQVAVEVHIVADEACEQTCHRGHCWPLTFIDDFRVSYCRCTLGVGGASCDVEILPPWYVAALTACLVLSNLAFVFILRSSWRDFCAYGRNLAGDAAAVGSDCFTARRDGPRCGGRLVTGAEWHDDGDCADGNEHEEEQRGGRAQVTRTTKSRTLQATKWRAGVRLLVFGTASAWQSLSSDSLFSPLSLGKCKLQMGLPAIGLRGRFAASGTDSQPQPLQRGNITHVISRAPPPRR